MNDLESTFFLSAFFSGRVQGVGFRYSTMQLAKGFEVTGFVRNLADGRVELEIEGVESQCRQLVAAMEDELDAYVRKAEISVGRRPRRYDSFRIA